jgi:hypothetical protein
MKRLLFVFLILFIACNKEDKKEEKVEVLNSDAKSFAQRILKSQEESVKAANEIKRQAIEDSRKAEDNRPEVNIPNIFVTALMKTRIMTRDSGEALTESFIRKCVNEHTSVYVKFACNDIVFDYNAFLVSANDNIIIITEDGASVENRLLVKVNGDSVEVLDVDFEKLITQEKMAELINKKFNVKKYTGEFIRNVAHSHFRLIIPKESGQNIVVTSGELGYGNDHGYKPVAELVWENGQFVLK